MPWAMARTRRARTPWIVASFGAGSGAGSSPTAARFAFSRRISTTASAGLAGPLSKTPAMSLKNPPLLSIAWGAGAAAAWEARSV